MIGFVHRSVAVRSAIALPVLVLALAACGGSSSGGSPATSMSTSAAAPAGGPPGGVRVDIAAIQSCLSAAGISLPTPSGMPSGMPTGAPPSGFAGPNGTPPSGAAGRPGGGFGDLFGSKEAKAALAACGITVPSAPPTT